MSLLDEEAFRSIGELKARCAALEARVASLAAFAAAMLEAHPRRDELQTRWANHLGPAIGQFSELREPEETFGSAIPGWVSWRLGDDATGAG